jgi:small-conductance mechanosensitive channel
MSDPIAEYLQWKKQGGDLRARAKQAIEMRFRELLTEAAQLAEEYRADFGAALTPPASVTSFKFKAGAKKPVKKTAAPAKVPVAVAPADPKVVALEKQLAAARKKVEAAKTKGAATKNLEDRVYELEDDLRLATESV